MQSAVTPLPRAERQNLAERSEHAHELVLRRCLVSPDDIAVSGPDGELTYGQLHVRVARLARRLTDLGVGPEARVALCLARSADAVVALLGVLVAGGVHAPVDLTRPLERTRDTLARLAPVAVIADADSMATALATGLPVIELSDTIGGDDPGGEVILPDVPLHPDNLAYVLFTSGSTGEPKGVAMTHRGLSRLIRWQLSDGPGGLSTLYFTPPGFDVTFQEIFSTLASGGRLCLVPDHVRRDPESLLRALDNLGVERVFLPYVMLQELAKAAQRLDVVPRRLRQIVTAGEALVMTQPITELLDRLPGCRLDNHYGPTETHLATSFTLRQNNRPWPPLPPIGTAVAGARVYVLDADLEMTTADQPGEVHIGGEAVSRCYLGAPVQTAQRYLPDPHSGVPGARMYSTGDIARRDVNGVLHYLHRADRQIKVRGYRVEPGEVEHALTSHSQVRHAAVDARVLPAGPTVLVAHVVCEAERPSQAELRAHLAARLPDYMVPARIAFLDALPMTATGKIDRRQLAELDPVSADADADSALDAGSSIEVLLTSVWRRVLGHDEFEAEDDFFDVGGDSLLATWVVAEISRALGRQVALSALLEDSTIADLSARLAADIDSLSTAFLPAGSQITTLRPGPARRSLVLFHPLGGEVVAYREVARQITAPLRVLGITWTGERPGAAGSLESLAAAHVEQLRATQASPYLLAGWSFGGVLAFEVARQLTQAGESVEFLGLIDAHPTMDPITGVAPRDTPYLADLEQLLAEIDRCHTAGEAAPDVAELATEGTWIQLMGAAPARAVSAEHLRAPLTLARDNLAALQAYQPGPYTGDVEFFRSESLDARGRHAMLTQLRDLVDGTVRVHDLPGDHLTILRASNATALAAALDDVLQRDPSKGQ